MPKDYAYEFDGGQRLNLSHDVTIKWKRNPTYSDMRDYHAKCSCGWQGPVRTESKTAAQEDGYTHRQARSTQLTPRRAL